MELRQVDLNTNQCTNLGKHLKPIKCVAYSATHNTIITGSWDETIKLWDTRSPSPCIGTYEQPGRVFTMALSNNRLIVGASERHVWIWDLRSLSEPQQRRESSLKYQTRCINAFIEGDGYALASTEGRVAVEYFDSSPNVQAMKYAFKCHRAKGPDGVEQVYPVNVIVFHPIFGTFATGGCDSFVSIWDGRNKKRLFQFKKYPNSIASIAFSHAGTQMAVASSYTFHEGDKGDMPEQIFIRDVSETEVLPKSRKPTEL